jgi:uncharacterized membrane protein
MAADRDRPVNIDDTLEALAVVRLAQREESTRLQRLADEVTAAIAHPLFVALLTSVVALWIGGNLLAQAVGLKPLDPPPFYWLDGAASLIAVYSTILILATQRREDEVNAYRDHLTLEIAKASDQKIAKVIALLEEIRRDSPGLRDRHDQEAEAMSVPTSARAVVDALTEKPFSPANVSEPPPSP